MRTSEEETFTVCPLIGKEQKRHGSDKDFGHVISARKQ